MFPLWYALAAFILFAFVAFLFLIFNLAHIIKFGLQSTKTSLVLGLYIFSFIGAMILALVILMPYDWSIVIDTSNLLNLQAGVNLPL